MNKMSDQPAGVAVDRRVRPRNGCKPALMTRCGPTMPKYQLLLRQTLEELALVRAAMGVACGYLWLVNNEPGTPNRYPPRRPHTKRARRCATS